MTNLDVLTPDTWITDELRVLGELGAGGMGRVYLAHDRVLDRKVAVKVLAPPPADDDGDHTDQGVRAMREARAVARVVHANVAAVYRLGTWQGRPFIEMEWVDGPSLRDVLVEGKVPDAPTRRRWLVTIASAIQYAHDCGIIHCDLKPENILLGDDGVGGRRIKLVDFGLARGRDLHHRSPTQAHGTLAYLPPEAGLKAPSRAGDQYSYAMLAAELLTGERPAHSAGEPIVDRHRLLPMRAREVLTRGLSERPGDRFPTVSALCEALSRSLRAVPEPSLDVPPGEPPALRRLRSPGQLTPEWLTALPREEFRTLLLALVALAPPGHPGLIERLVGELDDHPTIAELRADHWIEGGLGEWQLRDRGMTAVVLHRLRGQSVAALRAALANALEGGLGGSDWVREDAARLYMAAGRPADAARLVLAGARGAVPALERDHGLQRAIALLGSPTHLEAWLKALLERMEWALRCGWQKVARRGLSVAQGLAAEGGWRPGEALSTRLLVAEAGLRLLEGRPADALSVLDRVASGATAGAGPLAGLDVATAARARTLLALDRSEEASVVLRPALDRGADLLPADQQRAHALGDVLLAGTSVLLAAGQIPAATTLAARNLGLQLDMGDSLACANALVTLGRVHLADADVVASLACAEEADELLQPVGPVGQAGEVALLRAECALLSGEPLAAMRHTQNALWLWQGHGASGPRMRALATMVQVCRAADDAAGLWQHQVELKATHRRGRRPV